MTTLRKLLYYFVGFIAFVTLMQLPFAFAVSSVFSNPKTIDQILEDGGVYKNFTDIAIKNVESETGNDEAKKLLADQKVKEIITSSVEPSDIQKASQSAINGMYDWLEGKTPQPEFTIDLTAPAERATSKLSSYAAERSKTLPACTLQQLQTVDFKSDLLSIPCLPPGVTSEQIGSQFAAEAKQQVEFLEKPSISAKDIFKDTDFREADYADVPKAYQNLHQSKWYNLGFLLLLVTLLIFARRDRLTGVRFVSKLLLAAGLLLAVFLLTFLWGKSQPVAGDDALGRVFLSTITSLIGEMAVIIRWFAAAYLLLGASGLMLSGRFSNHDTTPDPEPTKQPTEVE